MSKITLNSIPTNVFKVNASELSEKNATRASIVGAGRLLAYEYARKGQIAMHKANGIVGDDCASQISSTQYKELNEKFQAEHLLYAAKRACAMTDEQAPENLEELKRNSLRFYGNPTFYRVLQSIYQEILTPILPAVYSEAVSQFADVVEVNFGETYSLTVDSNDIPIFQDSAWGALRSVPRNRFYAKDYTLNPQPKTCQISAKWTQLISNNMDFGKWFANITAGMYAKTMGMWSAAMTAAASDTSLVPSGLIYTFSSINWVTLANKLAAVNGTSINNIFAFGNAVALAKVLPTQATGSANTDMDAALAVLLGKDYIQSAQLGQFMNVRLMPLQDAVVPGTQNGNVTTILDATKVWLMAGNARKPMTIAYNAATPIQFEIDPTKSADGEIGINLTIALDSVSVFANRVGYVTI